MIEITIVTFHDCAKHLSWLLSFNSLSNPSKEGVSLNSHCKDYEEEVQGGEVPLQRLHS